MKMELELTSYQFQVLLLATLWSLPWKGVALWKAANRNHKAWFVILLIFNTLAILDAIYIFFFADKPDQEPKKSK